MKIKILNFIDNYFRKKDTNLFYGDFLAGAGNKLEIFLLDLLKKEFYKIHLKYSRRKTFKKVALNSKLSKKEYDSYLNEFKSNGIVVIKSYFSQEAEEILKNYDYFFKKIEKDDKDYKRIFSLSIKEPLFQSVLDSNILQMLCEYTGTQQYLRASPALNITYPGFSDITSKNIGETKYKDGGFANFYHLDTPNLRQYHILLKDVGMDDPHMLFARKSNKKYFGLHYRIASEEYVNANYEITHCIGPKGTVYVFDGGSGLHRMYATEKNYRMTMDIMFTPGNSILKDSCPIVNLGEMKFEGFDDLQKESLRFLK
ncbi:hypothetical protein [Leptospira bandrabouensis]|uniref:Phytanoyl-CoA dioxygenase n=1 Tax=Leptospira bandrabouensis TaxID=2484903 RepID=A0A6H3NQG3_9LEPT|nr:hypothetical protein [Leptospira bandrabouensis]TGN12192.1 hypothetical protein EHR08_12450 [Leptospira bandrabouensis]